MATRKRRENTTRKPGLRGVKEELETVPQVKIEAAISANDYSRSSLMSGPSAMGQMSLDVLAQVATETLEKEPRITATKKLTKRSVQSLDVLTLEQIRMLSDKALVNMFAEMSANEMTRNYTYQCYLIPKECHEQFTSFGNENRARMRVRAHLLGHIGELLKESSESGRGRVKFTAEPLPARRKRLQAEQMAQKKLSTKLAKQKKAQNTKIPRSPVRKGQDEGFTSIRPTSSRDTAAERAPTATSTRRPMRRAAQDSVGMWAENSSDSGSGTVPMKARPKKGSRKLTSGTNFVGRNARLRVCLNRTGQEQEESSGDFARHVPSRETTKEREPSATGPSGTTERNLEENEQLIIDLLSRTQPYMDHNYTTIFGKRLIGDQLLDLSASDLEDEDQAARSSGKRNKTTPPTIDPDAEADAGDISSKTLTLRVNAGTVPTPNNIHIPIIRLARIPVAPDGTPLVSAEEVVVQESDALEDIMRKHNIGASNAMRPYPPMPKSELARRGKVVVPEEEMSSSDEEEEAVELPPRRMRETRRIIEGSAEWERKMALKCIRELRCKKKEATLLLCKICKNKTFTATATLMYHYRSHAGIKPFVCLICNTTFTRQHSLNYHMLIHNNQSRFTCKDCGRKFRHPSHFKEHLRRHTGETPFHCTDCPLRFKTRNTYKRHLKTRHGKLLTAKGIRQMAYEDYLKVRAKKTHRASEEEEDEEDYEEEEEEEEEMEEVVEEEEEEEVAGDCEDRSSADGSGNLTTDNQTHATETIIPNRLLQFCQQVAEVS